MEDKETELEPIKVNQGEINLKNEQTQTKLVDCSPSPQSSPSGRGGDLARFWVQESVTTPATVGGARTDVNKAELEPIKVNQGDNFLKGEAAQEEMAGRPAGGGDGPSPLRGKQVESGDDLARFGVHENVTLIPRRSAETPLQRAKESGMPRFNWGKLKPIKVDQGEVFICRTGRSRTRTRTRTRRIHFRCGRACHSPPHSLAAARARELDVYVRGRAHSVSWRGVIALCTVPREI